ncbi:MAG: Maf family protein [Rickettsiales bacterium]
MRNRFILASASPRRLQLLKQIGISPDEVIAANIDESVRKQEIPEVYVLRMAMEKARAIVSDYPKSLVLAADTIVVCGRRILGKADDEKEAEKYLRLLSGCRHRVYSSVCIINNGKEHTVTVVSRVKMARLHDKDISAYIKTGNWQGKAGAYAIQEGAEEFITWINGSYSNIVGLPLYETSRLLKRAQWSRA